MKSLIFQKNNHKRRLSSYLLRVFILSLAVLNLVFLFPGLPFPGSQSVYILRAQAQGPDTFKNDADALLQKGIMYLGRGDSGPALRSLQQALELYREIKDPHGEGNALKNIGNVYYVLAEYPKAIEYQKETLALARAIKDRDLECKALLNLGSIFRDQGDLTRSIMFYRESLTLSRKINNQEVEGKAVGGLGMVLYKLGNYSQAIGYLEEALRLAREINDRPVEGTALTYLGRIHDAMKDTAGAIKFYEQALPISREIKNFWGELAILSALSSTCYEARDYGRAISYAQIALKKANELKVTDQAFNALSLLVVSSVALGDNKTAIEYGLQRLTLARKLHDLAREGDALENLGISYLALGNYLKALENFLQLQKVGEEIPDYRIEGKALGYLGQVYVSLGELDRAARCFQQQLSRSKGPKGTQQMYEAFQNLGDLQIQNNDFQKAIAFYQQSLSVASKLKDKKLQIRALSRLGNACHYVGDYTEAVDYLKQSLAMARARGDFFEEWKALQILGRTYIQTKDRGAVECMKRMVALSAKLNVRAENVALAELGSAYLMIGDNKKALESFRQSLARSRESNDKEGEGMAMERLGIALFSSGRLPQAEDVLRDAMKVWESLRAGLGSHDVFKVSIFERQSSTYRHLQKVLVAQNKNETALEIAERGRARAFVELLAQRLSSTPVDQVRSPSIRQIREVAREEGATLIEYSILHEDFKLLIWVVKPTGEVTLRQVDLIPYLKDDRTMGELVHFGRNSLGARGLVLAKGSSTKEMSPMKHPFHMGYTPLKQLYKLLIQPISDQLPADPNARVIFIPQEALFMVPFAALQSRNGEYLIEKHTILTAPSIQVLDLTRQHRERIERSDTQREAKGQSIVSLVVGNPTMPNLPGSEQPLPPLPGAEVEAKAIARLLNTQAVIRDKATKGNVVQQMCSAKYIHLATHGILDDIRGLGSAIALSPEGGDNGLLTAEEVLTLKLNAELVVLSACNTGRGRITGDGVIGLSRSFISAGVPSVVVSLWSVPDAPTALLMSKFYENLQHDTDRARALRKAMLTTMRQDPAPLSWAAFTLIGESE